MIFNSLKNQNQRYEVRMDFPGYEGFAYGIPVPYQGNLSTKCVRPISKDFAAMVRLGGKYAEISKQNTAPTGFELSYGTRLR